MFVRGFEWISWGKYIRKTGYSEKFGPFSSGSQRCLEVLQIGFVLYPGQP